MRNHPLAIEMLRAAGGDCTAGDSCRLLPPETPAYAEAARAIASLLMQVTGDRWHNCLGIMAVVARSLWPADLLTVADACDHFGAGCEVYHRYERHLLKPKEVPLNLPVSADSPIYWPLYAVSWSRHRCRRVQLNRRIKLLTQT